MAWNGSVHGCNLLCSSDAQIERLPLWTEHLWTRVVRARRRLRTSIVSLAIVVCAVREARGRIATGTATQRCHARGGQVDDRGARRRCVAAAKAIQIARIAVRTTVSVRRPIDGQQSGRRRHGGRRGRRRGQCVAVVHAGHGRRDVIVQLDRTRKTVALQVVVFAFVDAERWRQRRLMMMGIQIVLRAQLRVEMMMVVMVVGAAVRRGQVIRVVIGHGHRGHCGTRR